MSRSDPNARRRDGETAETDAAVRNQRDTDRPPEDAVDSQPGEPTSHTHYPYRKIAAGMFVLGGIFCTGAVILDTTAVLFVIGAIGLFSGVLTYYLGLDRFIGADVSERIQASTAESYRGICADLDLSGRRVYVPKTGGKDPDVESRSQSGTHSSDRTGDVRLFVPKRADVEPDDIPRGDLDSFVVRNGSEIVGLSIRPTGAGLFASFLTLLDEPLAENPQKLSRQLAEAGVDEFGLAKSINAEFDSEQRTLSVQFFEPLYADSVRFDHPLVSLYAIGFAVGLDSPIETTIMSVDPIEATFRW